MGVVGRSGGGNCGWDVLYKRRIVCGVCVGGVGWGVGGGRGVLQDESLLCTIKDSVLILAQRKESASVTPS